MQLALITHRIENGLVYQRAMDSLNPIKLQEKNRLSEGGVDMKFNYRQHLLH